MWTVTIRSDFTILCRYIGLLYFIFLIFLTPKPMYDTILGGFRLFRVRYRSCEVFDSFMYDINLRATHTMIHSVGGVTILIYLVSSAMDSIRQSAVVFKPVPVPSSDPKSEFLCQSSLSCAEPADPPEHLVHLGYLPHPRHHVSSILSQS